MPTILIVEDEQHLADGLRFNLEAEGYRAQIVDSGEAALDVLAPPAHGIDLVVLDVMLPDIDGFRVVSELRRTGRFVPVLILTARSRPADVLQGFAAGADDYLPKPFDLPILVARIRSLLRRLDWAGRTGGRPAAETGAPPPGEPPYAFEGRTIDFDALEVAVGDRRMRLTLMEANLLRYLIRHEGRTVPRKALLEHVWQVHEHTDTRAIDNFIVRLRRYLEEEPARPRHLLTVRGVGYRFVARPE